MLLLPFRRLTLCTQLHPDEVYRRLAAAVEPMRRFRSESAGSRIEVVLRLHIAVALFITIWLVVVATSAVTIASDAHSRGRSPAMALVWAGIIVFVCTAMQRGFVVESRKDQRFLEELIR